MGLNINYDSKKSEVKDLIEDSRKAKINWVLSITQLTLADLEKIAKELGLVIIGEFIALPEEAEKMNKSVQEKPKAKSFTPLEKQNEYDISFCPSCSIEIKEEDLSVGFCSNCGVEFAKILHSRMSGNYFQKGCNACGAINPVKATYCVKCGKRDLTRFTPRPKTFHKQDRTGLRPEWIVYFIFNFIISVGLVIFVVIDLVRYTQFMALWLAILLIIVGALLLVVPSFFIYKFGLWYEYGETKWIFNKD